MRVRILACLVFSGLGGCAAPRAVGYEAGVSAASRDALHRSTPAPRLGDPGELKSATVSAHLDVPCGFIRRWFEPMSLVDALPGTRELPGVERVELLTERWGAPGARRRVVLRDETTALEQVVENELPDRFRYVVWNYTSAAAKYVRYGVGEFRFQAEEGGTRVTWTYGFQPRGWPASWLVGSWVQGPWRRYMEAAMVRMKELAEHSDQAAPEAASSKE